MPRTYEPIASITTSGTTTSSVTFSNLPSSFTDLIVVEYVSFTVVGNQSGIDFGDTSTLYSSTNLRGNGTSATSQRFTSGNAIGSTPGDSASGTTWMTVVRQVMSYSNTNVHKTILHSTSDTASYVNRTVGLWRNTNAISTVRLFAVTGAYASGSTFSLYGVRAA